MRVTIGEAAAHCGYRSRTVIYRLQRDGLLRDYEVGREGRSLVLETHPPGRVPLRDHIASCVQFRAASPLWQRQREPLVELTDEQLAAHFDAVMAPLDALPAPDWEGVSERLNAFLGPTWPAPPYTAEQAATVAMCLSLAEEAVDG